jgi:hypothetical protein
MQIDDEGWMDRWTDRWMLKWIFTSKEDITELSSKVP